MSIAALEDRVQGVIPTERHAGRDIHADTTGSELDRRVSRYKDELEGGSRSQPRQCLNGHPKAVFMGTEEGSVAKVIVGGPLTTCFRGNGGAEDFRFL
jgi:hypothetical protein